MKKRKVQSSLPYELQQIIFKYNKYSPLYKYYKGPKKTPKKKMNYLLENLLSVNSLINTYVYSLDRSIYVVERRENFDLSEIDNNSCTILYLKGISKITNHYNIPFNLKKMIIFRCNVDFDDNLFNCIKARTLKIKHSHLGYDALEMKNIEQFYSKKNNLNKGFVANLIEINKFTAYNIEEDEFSCAYKRSKIYLRNFRLKPDILRDLRTIKFRNTHYRYEDIKKIFENNTHLIKLILKSTYSYEEISKLMKLCKHVQYLDLDCRKRENLSALLRGIFKLRKPLRILKLKIKNFNMLLLKDMFIPILQNCKIFLN